MSLDDRVPTVTDGRCPYCRTILPDHSWPQTHGVPEMKERNFTGLVYKQCTNCRCTSIVDPEAAVQVDFIHDTLREIVEYFEGKCAAADDHNNNRPNVGMTTVPYMEAPTELRDKAKEALKQYRVLDIKVVKA